MEIGNRCYKSTQPTIRFTPQCKKLDKIQVIRYPEMLNFRSLWQGCQKLRGVQHTPNYVTVSRDLLRFLLTAVLFLKEKMFMVRKFSEIWLENRIPQLYKNTRLHFAGKHRISTTNVMSSFQGESSKKRGRGRPPTYVFSNDEKLSEPMEKLKLSIEKRRRSQKEKYHRKKMEKTMKSETSGTRSCSSKSNRRDQGVKDGGLILDMAIAGSSNGANSSRSRHVNRRQWSKRMFQSLKCTWLWNSKYCCTLIISSMGLWVICKTQLELPKTLGSFCYGPTATFAGQYFVFIV